MSNVKALDEKYEQLLQRGFVVCENFLDVATLNRLRGVTDRLIDTQPQADFDAFRSPGSLISVYEDPYFAELITFPEVLEIMAEMGFEDPKWASGYVAGKPPHSPRLFWHQDWWGWDDPCSYAPQLPMVFFLYYLTDTDRHNGCLRVIPGSHLKRHPLHAQVCDADTRELRRIENPDHPAFQSIPEEIDVPVCAGDVIIGDARLLHATHSNQSDQRSTVVAILYLPDYSSLSNSLPARISRFRMPISWPSSAQTRIEPLIPTYHGERYPVLWHYVPGEMLR